MLDSNNRILTFDSEAIGLLDDIREGDTSSIHIIHCKDKETGETFTFFDPFEKRVNAEWLDEYEDGYADGTIEDGIKFVRDAKVLIIQNGMGYDFLAFEKAAGKLWHRNHFEATSLKKYPFKTMDTYAMSCTLNPERKVPQQAYALGMGNVGPHSIAAHGIRIGRFKPENEDWSRLTKHMIHRVEEDVEIGEDFYDYLWREDWETQAQRPNPKTGMSIANAYWCELRMANTVARQAQRGFAIDVKFIGDLLNELDEQINATYEAFRPHMPPRIKKKKRTPAQIESDVQELRNRSGDPSLAYTWEAEQEILERRGAYHTTKWELVTKKGQYIAAITKLFPQARGFKQDHPDPLVDGPFTPVEFEEIPLGNREEVKKILYELGWRGVNFNDTERDYIDENGELPKPWAGKIDEDSMDKWREKHTIPDWAEGIAAWYILKSRRGQLLNADDPVYFQENGKWKKQTNGKRECRGILPRARIYKDGAKYGGESAQDYFEREGKWPTSGHWRVPAIAFHAATNTFRMRHRVVVNIPSRGLYGKEMRRCFIAGPGKMVLGCDGAGLELRMLSHFMADAVYQDTVLNGDIHTYNQELAGLPTRDMAKTFIYAFLYGSGIPNLAAQLGLPEHEMAEAVARFKRELPKLASLLDAVEAAGKKFGYLMSLDGRWGRIRRKSGQLALHTALNVLLQMTGSLTMKWAHVAAEDMAVEAGLIEDVNDFPIIAHQHDEAQMEVPRDEVKYMRYEIGPNKEDWKAEEKKQYVDEEGMIWSAPRIVESNDNAQVIERRFHLFGHIYCKALQQTADTLSLRCPCDGEYMIGDSWQETH